MWPKIGTMLCNSWGSRVIAMYVLYMICIYFLPQNYLSSFICLLRYQVKVIFVSYRNLFCQACIVKFTPMYFCTHVACAHTITHVYAYIHTFSWGFTVGSCRMSNYVSTRNITDDESKINIGKTLHRIEYIILENSNSLLSNTLLQLHLII